MKNFDDTTWQWEELADACYIQSEIFKNWSKNRLAHHSILSVSDDDDPCVIISGELAEFDIRCFLMNAVDCKYITSESSPADLNKIDERYSYGWHNGERVTYIYPVRDMYLMIEREELSEDELAEMDTQWRELQESMMVENDNWEDLV